jgi:hypothetical protein
LHYCRNSIFRSGAKSGQYIFDNLKISINMQVSGLSFDSRRFHEDGLRRTFQSLRKHTQNIPKAFKACKFYDLQAFLFYLQQAKCSEVPKVAVAISWQF